MYICDEYVALRAIALGRPPEMTADSPIAITSSTWWRVLRPAHAVIAGRATNTPTSHTGSLSTILEKLSDSDLEILRSPDQRAVEILDSRRLLDTAAAIGLDHRGGLLQLESLAAALVHGGELWYGRHQNLTETTAATAKQLGITVHVISDAPN